MKFAEMMTAEPAALSEHYRAVRALAFNNANMAAGTAPRGRTRGKLARQMGYLMRQVSMCETAADKRGIRL